MSCLHADLAMETADPLMMAAATRKYQEDCMVLVAQQVCNGRNVCGLEICPNYYHQLTSDEFQVPPSICANLKSPRKKRFLGMLLGLQFGPCQMVYRSHPENVEKECEHLT